MSSGSTGSYMPRWQLAMIIGTPIAIGLGYLYWRRSHAATAAGKRAGLDKAKTLSIDDAAADKEVAAATKAAASATPARELTPLEKAQAAKNEGNSRFKSGAYDEAIKFYDQAIALCPRDKNVDLATFYQNRAAAYEQLRKWSAVKEDCSAALELNPKYTKALNRRARALEQLKELESCLEDITATCILEGFSNKSTLAFADRVLKVLGRQHAKEAMARRTPISPSKHFVRNYFASFTNDPIVNISVSTSGDAPPVGFVRAKLAFDRQDYDAIIPACSEELDEATGGDYRLEAQLLRATFYLLTGQFAEAEADLNAVIDNQAADPRFRVNALIKRASLRMQTERTDDCFVDFSAALELDTANADLYHHRGQVYTLLEMLDAALSDFERAVELSPEQGITFIHKCYAEYRLALREQDHGKLFKVIERFTQAIERFPDCVECYSLMAQVLTDQAQYAQADSFFEKASKLDPHNATLYVHRGLLQLQWAGDVEKAMKLIKRAIEVDEKCEFAYETLGTIEVQRGRMREAIELFEQAIQLAKSELELVHLYSLKDAAIAQSSVTQKMGIDISALAALANQNAAF